MEAATVAATVVAAVAVAGAAATAATAGVAANPMPTGVRDRWRIRGFHPHYLRGDLRYRSIW